MIERITSRRLLPALLALLVLLAGAGASHAAAMGTAWMRRSDLVAVRRGGKVVLQKRNPLPVGRKVKVRVVRRRNGTIDIYSA